MRRDKVKMTWSETGMNRREMTWSEARQSEVNLGEVTRSEMKQDVK